MPVAWPVGVVAARGQSVLEAGVHQSKAEPGREAVHRRAEGPRHEQRVAGPVEHPHGAVRLPAEGQPGADLPPSARDTDRIWNRVVNGRLELRQAESGAEDEVREHIDVWLPHWEERPDALTQLPVGESAPRPVGVVVGTRQRGRRSCSNASKRGKRHGQPLPSGFELCPKTFEIRTALNVFKHKLTEHSFSASLLTTKFSRFSSNRHFYTHVQYVFLFYFSFFLFTGSCSAPAFYVQ